MALSASLVVCVLCNSGHLGSHVFTASLLLRQEVSHADSWGLANGRQALVEEHAAGGQWVVVESVPGREAGLALPPSELRSISFPLSTLPARPQLRTF